MTPVETITLATYFFVLIVLAIYGWHRYYLVYLYMRNRDQVLPSCQPYRVQGGGARSGVEAGARRVHRDFRCRFHPGPRLSGSPDAALHRPAGRHGAGAVGAHQPGLHAAHENPVDPARRPLRARTRPPP